MKLSAQKYTIEDVREKNIVLQENEEQRKGSIKIVWHMNLVSFIL